MITAHQLSSSKNKKISLLLEHLERFFNLLRLILFRSRKFDTNLLRPHCYLFLKTKNYQTSFSQNSKQLITFKFSDIQIRDILNFHGGATIRDFFIKAYETSETIRFIAREGFDHADKIQNTEPPSYDAFYSELHSGNPLQIDYAESFRLVRICKTTERNIVKEKLSKSLPTVV